MQEQLLIQLTDSSHIVVNAKVGRNVKHCLEIAHEFCKAFHVMSVIVHANDRFIQVTRTGPFNLDQYLANLS